MNKLVSGKSENEYSLRQPSLSLRDISPGGRDKFGLCVRAKKSPALDFPELAIHSLFGTIT